jgi:hypothetical protein
MASANIHDTQISEDDSEDLRRGSEPVRPSEQLPQPLLFVVQYYRVEIHPSARRHGIADDDIRHAIEHSLVVDDVGEEPDRWLVIGPDRASNLLEVIVLVSDEGDELIIHAMPMRAIYRKLLDP